MEGNPTNLAQANTETVPKNPTDVGVALVLEDHDDARTVLVLENRVDKVTIIPENHAGDWTVHVRISMLTGVQIPQKSNIPTTQLWTP